ncbi:hypothetical protein U1Q18_042489 [Sarracenia purpurea var. burkii]
MTTQVCVIVSEGRGNRFTVDMDTEDGDSARTPPGLEGRNSEATVLPVQDYLSDGSPRYDKKWDAEGQNLREVKELGRSKWSDDLDDDNAKRTKSTEGNSNALSGLIKAYANEGRSVHWGDQISAESMIGLSESSKCTQIVKFFGILWCWLLEMKLFFLYQFECFSGASLQRQGKYREAIKYQYSMVLVISEREGKDSGNIDAYGVIADCYTELGELERAGKFYDKYIARLQSD